MIDQLIDERALRLRHLAAMETIEGVADPASRWELLFAVVCPSLELLEATCARARAQLQPERAAA